MMGPREILKAVLVHVYPWGVSNCLSYNEYIIHYPDLNVRVSGVRVFGIVVY